MASWMILGLHLLYLWTRTSYANIACSKCEMNRSSNQITCPDSFHPQKFTVTLSDLKDYPQSALTLKCHHKAENINISLIEDCQFSSVKYVRFERCPLFNVSFSEFFQQIGIHPENVTSLLFVDVGQRDQYDLQEWHLQGLGNLKNLLFDGNQFSSIPQNLLKATPELKHFRFSINKLETLPQSLFASTPNLTEVYLHTNEFTSLPDNLFANLPKLTNLSLWKNNLTEIRPELLSTIPNLQSLELSHNNILHLDSKVFSNLPNLRKILLNTNSLESLPVDIFHNCPSLEILNAEYNKIPALPSELFKNSTKIDTLEFGNNQIANIPENTFQGLNNMVKLKLNRNSLKSLFPNVFADLTSLETLDLQSNLLEYLPHGSFDNLRKLNTLVLKNNSLSELPDNIFKNCENLNNLHVSHNKINVLHSSSFPHPTSTLQVLDLSNNNISFSSIRNSTSIASQEITVEEHFPLSEQIKLHDLSLSSNSINAVPQAFSTELKELAKLNLKGNNIEYLESNDLSFMSNDVIVDLSYNKIKGISLQEMEYIHSQKTVNVYFQGNPLICNCDIYQLARLLQGRAEETENMFQLNVIDQDKVKCSYPEKQNIEFPVKAVNTESLVCRLKSCPAMCTCFTRPHDTMFIINCSYQGLKAIPKLKDNYLPEGNLSITLNLRNNSITDLSGLQDPEYSSLVNLTIPNNKLSFINDSVLPQHLQVLDIRGNNFTSLPKSILELFNSSSVILSLGDNPWRCNCDLDDLHNFLREPNRKVTDSHNIICLNIEEPLIQVKKEDLCPIIQQPMIIASITSITIFLFLFFVLGTVSVYKYQQDIKVWLFTHRLCLWAVAQEEQDADKKYDAFISYSNKDEEFVNSVLVPGLESGDPKYKVCLHYRDWIPGEYIQNQIDQSIEASSRTIVILSSNFIENVWGQLEFKTAHSKALKDKTNKIIVIVFGEVPPDSELDDELRLYLSTRTYLQWRDPKFWEKLRYVMPHPQQFITKQHKRKENLKLELVHSNSKQNT
uniref:Toll3 n=2 Tax=Procambarus clarkii TaxID=6728 RepID=A0A1S5RQT5_PROCL|nr:Toll3 [Procambarus clarkii]